MRIAYDLHLHSCLSPCGDRDMTPSNLVNMARLAGLDCIALTDHNSCLNVPAARKAAEGTGLTVVPGMELCTAEEAMWSAFCPLRQRRWSFPLLSEGHCPMWKTARRFSANS